MCAQVKVIFKAQKKSQKTEKGILWRSGKISSRNHEDNSTKRTKSVISEAIIVLNQGLDKAEVTSIIFRKTREQLDFMRQI